MSRFSRPSGQGFSLVEVLVAVAIVDAGVADAQGVPLVRLSAIIPRY